jgi:DNA-binding transcriptional regulator YhcF (GntR family)
MSTMPGDLVMPTKFGKLRAMSLDPDDSRPPYVQVASQLRAAILTGKYPPGSRLPSGNELAETYGVARQTVQQALRPLREEGLIVGRQGSGTFVRSRTERPVELRPHVERAFAATDVTIDFAGFSGETLASAMLEPLDKIRAGRLTPQSISVRVLIPDYARPWSFPCRVEDLADSPAFRTRMGKIADRSLAGIAHSIEELGTLGLVPRTSIAIRTHGATPLFKVYILNGDETFLGLYPITQTTIPTKGGDEQIWDLGGKDTPLFHHDTGDPAGAEHVQQYQAWFDAMWTSVARDHDL